MLFFSPTPRQLHKQTPSSDRTFVSFPPPPLLTHNHQLQDQQRYPFLAASPIQLRHHRRRLSRHSQTRTTIRNDPFRLFATIVHLRIPSSSFPFASFTILFSSISWNTIIPSISTFPSISTTTQRPPHALSFTTLRHTTIKQQQRPPKHNRKRTLVTLLIMASSLSSLTHAQLSLGCFASGLSPSSSSPTLPVLPGLTPPYRDIYMSQGACSNYCKTSQYMYAIVEAGTECFCSNQAPPDANQVEDKWCDKPCAGYPFEMCGSVLVAGDVDLAGGGGVKVGGGAYANIMLVGNSLAPGPATPTSPSAAVAVVSPVISLVSGDSPEKKGSPPATATAAAMAKGSLHAEVRHDSKSEEEKSKSLGDDQDSEDEGGDDDDDDDEDNNDDGDVDEEGDDGDDDEDGSEEDDQPGNSGKALSGHGQNSSSSSSKIPFASISVAVACLIGICAFLIYLGKKRKREHVRAAWVESVFGANGGSTQGGPSPGPYNNGTMNSAMTGRMMSGVSHPSAGHGGVYQQRGSNVYDDRNSMMSDSETDRDRGGMVDRRQSTASTVAGAAATPMSAGGVGGTRRESTISRAIHNTVMLPVPVVRGSYGSTTVATPTWEGGYSGIRSPEPQQQQHNDGYHYRQHQHHHSNERYEEYFDQDECEDDAAELPHLPIDYTPSPGTAPAAPPTRVQRPAVVVYSKNSKGVRTSVHPHQPGGSPFDQPTTTISNGNSNCGSGANKYCNDDPFQDRLEHLHHHKHQHQHHHHNHQQQRHSMHTSTGPGEGHRSSVVGVSDYRRPHSYSAGSQGVGRRDVVDADPRTLSYRTHVLDESSDQESIADSEVAVVIVSSSSTAAAAGTGGEGSNSSTMGKLSGNLLKDHFKRLSTPYVKAIRDQQQHQVTRPTSLSCNEEGHLHRDVDLMVGGRNGYESSMPVPGLASGNERRWSRALLKGVVGVGHRSESFGEETNGAIEELSGDEQGAISRGEQGGHGHFRGHLQVHSGSLASFRGLDDPSHPRLRVMNPDDGVS